jgi:hypothetical protein
MRLSQLLDRDGTRVVAATFEDCSFLVPGVTDVRSLALSAHAAGMGLRDHVAQIGRGERVDLHEALGQGRVLCPVDHPDPTHCLVTGTGLTHLGSASARDAMHQTLASQKPDAMSDSMRTFKAGLEGGKPAPGAEGVQPEWFYKGDARTIATPGGPLISPAFALDAGEEPEVAGVYVIAPDGTPLRIGFVIANEFSDHVMERQNYLNLAHSKLRAVSFGPELLTGDLPQHLSGTSKVLRGEQVIWEDTFLTGEANMTHSISNLERHHFKYGHFRTPGDVHFHMFGTASLSFSGGVRCKEGDVFEIAIEEFGKPLVNPLRTAMPERIEIAAL